MTARSYRRVLDLDDEEAAFVYAEERMRATSSRLMVENRATRTAQAFWRAIRAHDVDGILGCCSDRIVYDDRRRISGNPIHDRAGFRAAFERILEQYNRFEERMLAVRGEHLSLASSRWLNDSGYESTYLHVSEVDDAGKIIFEGRFDGDDFEGAYRELDERYYAAEGAAFAVTGTTATEWILALTKNDFDRAFGELSTPNLRVENRSLTLFPDRDATELRASFEQLAAMVGSSRTWVSAMHWTSPTCIIIRLERDAAGTDGENYEWTRLHVCEFQNSRLAAVCQFPPGDVDLAFAYAEERANATGSRLAVTNGASQTARALTTAMNANDLEGALGFVSDRWVFDDRRRFGGNPPEESTSGTDINFVTVQQL